MRKVRGFPIADVIGPFLGELVGQAGDLAPREGRAETFGGRHAHRRPHDPIGATRAGKSKTDAERLLAEPADRGARRERIRPEQEDRLAFDVACQQVALYVGQRTPQRLPRGGATDEEAAGGQGDPGLLGDQFRTDAGDALAPIEQGLGGIPFLRLRRCGEHDRAAPTSLLEEICRGRGDAGQAERGKDGKAAGHETDPYPSPSELRDNREDAALLCCWPDLSRI